MHQAEKEDTRIGEEEDTGGDRVVVWNESPTSPHVRPGQPADRSPVLQRKNRNHKEGAIMKSMAK